MNTRLIDRNRHETPQDLNDCGRKGAVHRLLVTPFWEDRNEKNLKAKRNMTAVTPFLSASDDFQSFDEKLDYQRENAQTRL
jgi:hypothetical protein